MRFTRVRCRGTSGTRCGLPQETRSHALVCTEPTSAHAMPAVGSPTPVGRSCIRQLGRWGFGSGEVCERSAGPYGSCFRVISVTSRGASRPLALFNQTTISKIQQDPIQSFVPDLFCGNLGRWTTYASSGARRSAARRVQSTSQTEGGGASSGIQCSASGVQEVQRPAPLAQNYSEDLCRISGIPCTSLSVVGDKRDDPGVIVAPGIGTG